MTACVARMRDIRNANKILVKSLKERDHSEQLSVNGRIILKLTFGQQDLGMWTEFDSEYGPMASYCCEHGNEPSDSI
jgi:hypothetical protein